MNIFTDTLQPPMSMPVPMSMSDIDDTADEVAAAAEFAVDDIVIAIEEAILWDSSNKDEGRRR
jgi:hypothetical protein